MGKNVDTLNLTRNSKLCCCQFGKEQINSDCEMNSKSVYFFWCNWSKPWQSGVPVCEALEGCQFCPLTCHILRLSGCPYYWWIVSQFGCLAELSFFFLQIKHAMYFKHFETVPVHHLVPRCCWRVWKEHVRGHCCWNRAKKQNTSCKICSPCPTSAVYIFGNWVI